MQLIKAEEQHIEKLVEISKKAFDSDVFVGASEAGGPPEYDNYDWHATIMKQGHLFAAADNGKIVGGALLFTDVKKKQTLIGRIFIDPDYFRRGYGIELMTEIEKMDSDIVLFVLDTPKWNVRTNAFYQKLGYACYKQDKEFAYYAKRITR